MGPSDALPDRARITVIDDDEMVFESLKALLARESYELRYFSSGAVAVETLVLDPPDLILLDLMMPGKDGTEVCRDLRARRSTDYVPIIMVTSLDTKKELARCLEAGADDFITKPVSGIELRARIRSLLRIKHQYDALQAALRLRAELSHMLVHDLRSPLNVIRVCGEAVGKSAPAESDRMMAERIVQAGRKIASMADQLLLLAKVEAGKLVLARSEVDLRRLAVLAVENQKPVAEARRIRLVADASDEPVIAQVDANLMERVIENLLSNALKFVPAGGEVRVSVEPLDAGGVRLSVVDTGPGVPAEMRDRIFAAFESAPSSGQALNIGLGLAFCSMAVRAHGGRLELADNTPTGAIFRVEL